MVEQLISHIGIAVVDLDRSIALFERIIGCPVAMIEEVPDQQVKVAVFKGGSDGSDAARLELVGATSPNSPIARFIERRGEGLHHICLVVDDIERKLGELRASGVRLIDEKPRLGAEGRKIAFIHPESANGVLIELVQKAT